MKNVIVLLFIFLISKLGFTQIGGYALYLDGTSNSIEFSSTSDLTLTNISVEAWIKTTASTGVQEIFAWAKRVSYGNITEFRVSNGKLEFGINDGTWASVVSNTNINSGNWTHVAVTKESSSVKLYINGKLDASATISKNPLENQIEIGYMQDDGSKRNFFPGTLDEVRIWTGVRSESDIKSNMYRVLSGSETGLYAYYQMSNGSGTTLSDNKTSGTLYNGTLVNSPVWKASGCFSGPKNALDLDGTDDYVYISNGVVLGTTFTQEMWIYPTDASVVYRAILGKETGSTLTRPQCVYQYGKKLHFGFGDNSNWNSDITPDDVLSINAWNHIAFTFNGTTYLVYVNGRLVYTSLCASGKTPVNQPQSYIGKIDNFFKGKIDEVRIWSVVRTESQIRESMMSSIAGNETGLQAYYRMDYSDGTTLYDISSNARNGTLTSMDPATDWVSSDAFNTWIGCESNLWTTVSNWSRGSAPASTDNIGIYKWTLGNELSLSGVPTSNHIFFSSTSSPTLNSNFTINGEFLLNINLDLNGYTITLGSNGYLNESNYRLYGTSGTITTTRTLSNISSQNIGGLGAIITTSANMGSTTITRGHSTQGNNLSISRYYNISPTNNSGLNATLVFNYNDNEMNGNTESDLKLFKSTNSGMNWTVQNASTVNTTSNTITLTGLNNFSLWTAANANSPMPVELTAFTSNITGRDVKLNWQTNKEINNKGFEIERKTYDNNWIKIAYLKGKGTTNEITNYSFGDLKLNSGKYNYRLKQIDFNGNFVYHNLNGVVEIGIPSKFILSQNYPNPFNPSTKIDFQIPDDSYTVLKIYDITGKEVTTLVNEKLKAGFYTIQFSINQFSNNHIASGTYFYRLTCDGVSNFTSTKKMIILK